MSKEDMSGLDDTFNTEKLQKQRLYQRLTKLASKKR